MLEKELKIILKQNSLILILFVVRKVKFNSDKELRLSAKTSKRGVKCLGCCCWGGGGGAHPPTHRAALANYLPSHFSLQLLLSVCVSVRPSVRLLYRHTQLFGLSPSHVGKKVKWNKIFT